MRKLIINFFAALLIVPTPRVAAETSANDLLDAKNFAYALAAGGALIFAHGFAEHMGLISASSAHNEKPTPQSQMQGLQESSTPASEQIVQGLEGLPTTPPAHHSTIGAPQHRMAVGACFTLIIAPLWYLLSSAATKSINSPYGYLNAFGRLSRL